MCTRLFKTQQYESTSAQVGRVRFAQLITGTKHNPKRVPEGNERIEK